jgi:acyl transferase domain-containing protein
MTGDIAITGMACLLPGAPDVRTYWSNILDRVSAISDPPPSWHADLVLDPASDENDRVYSAAGGYLKELAAFDPVSFGVMPMSVDGSEPDQFLALRVAHEALADAGLVDRAAEGKRTEVVLGRGTYFNRGYVSLVQHGLVLDQTIRILADLHPEYTADELQEIRLRLKASLPRLGPETIPGLVPNIMCGRVMNRFGLMGPSYTVDAACASSLVALANGVYDLRAGRCDVAVVGGVQVSTPALIYMVFCQLNAISRRGHIRPFDRRADGTLLGEGLGMLVLRRREDAERDGDRVYALVKSIGIASDGRSPGLLAPGLEGEELAMSRAYEDARIEPSSIGLLEAHGTATPVGDATEVAAISRVFGSPGRHGPRIALGSVKSMIGHIIPASGAASLIKVALALYHGVLPPTLCEEPDPKLGLNRTDCYVNTEPRPWVHGGPHPRRAGVNAFGFGGINAHAVVEEYLGPAPGSGRRPLARRPRDPDAAGVVR